MVCWASLTPLETSKTWPPGVNSVHPALVQSELCPSDISKLILAWQIAATIRIRNSLIILDTDLEMKGVSYRCIDDLDLLLWSRSCCQ